MSAVFRLEGAGMRYGDVEVLRVDRLEFTAGELVTVVGPNGAGKSTLLGILAGLRGGYTGQCFYQGRDLRQWSRRAFSRGVSFVPQSLAIEFPFTAAQVVMMGRTPHCDGLFESEEDATTVRGAMEATDTLAFAARDFRSLSGGERQRVILATALAQSPRVLLLDEPTTFLDLKHQLGVQRLLAGLRDQGLLVIAATHELNFAAAVSDRVVVLDRGRVRADAPPGEALAPAIIREVFEVGAEIRPGPSGRPWISYGE